MYILWKYHILIHVQELSHITLGKCPEDECNIIYSVVMWEVHNSDADTKAQDSFWASAANIPETSHQVKAKNKQSVVTYQNKLHSYVLFYIWIFLFYFIQFSKTSKDFLFVKKFIPEDIFNFTMLFSGACKIWKYKASTKYSCTLKIIHDIKTFHKLLLISLWNVDQQEL